MSPTISGGFSTKNPADIDKVKQFFPFKEGSAPKAAVASESPKKSKEELMKLNKVQQTELLHKLGFEGKIPATEKDRIEQLLKLGA